MKKTIILIVSMAILLSFTAPQALGGLGMTAGSLDYGEVTRGGSKSLQYTLLNTGDSPVEISPVPENDFENRVKIDPSRAVIPAGGSQTLTVTFYMPTNVEAGKVFKGSIYTVAHTAPVAGETGAVGAAIQVATRKEGSAVAGKEIIREIPFLLIGVLLAIIAIILIIVALVIRGRKTR